jgi:membrane protease YdiL (CAAX protease family)
MPRTTFALAAFFIPAFVLPGIGWSLVSFGVVPQTSPLAILLWLTGWSVSIAGIAATWIAEGRGGAVRLLREAVRVRAPVQWWLFALLVPLAIPFGAAILLLLLKGEPVVLHPSALLGLVSPAVLAPFLFGPFGEEFGWRGFLLPRAAQRFGAPLACLVVGVIWAAWHWPLYVPIVAGSETPVRQAIALVAGVTGGSFLVGAVYLRTKSLLLAMVAHWSFNAGPQIVGQLVAGLPKYDLGAQEAGLAVLALLVAATLPAIFATDKRDRKARETAAVPA